MSAYSVVVSVCEFKTWMLEQSVRILLGIMVWEHMSGFQIDYNLLCYSLFSEFKCTIGDIRPYVYYVNLMISLYSLPKPNRNSVAIADHGFFQKCRCSIPIVTYDVIILHSTGKSIMGDQLKTR